MAFYDEMGGLSGVKAGKGLTVKIDQNGMRTIEVSLQPGSVETISVYGNTSVMISESGTELHGKFLPYNAAKRDEGLFLAYTADGVYTEHALGIASMTEDKIVIASLGALFSEVYVPMTKYALIYRSRVFGPLSEMTVDNLNMGLILRNDTEAGKSIQEFNISGDPIYDFSTYVSRAQFHYIKEPEDRRWTRLLRNSSAWYLYDAHGGVSTTTLDQEIVRPGEILVVYPVWS